MGSHAANVTHVGIVVVRQTDLPSVKREDPSSPDVSETPLPDPRMEEISVLYIILGVHRAVLIFLLQAVLYNKGPGATR